jgi:hypothetical protein
MSKQNKATIAIVLVIVMASSTLKLHYIRDGNNADVLWNGDEAYLFLGGKTLGYKVSYLGYPVALVRQYFGDVRLPDNERSSITVLRVTPSGVERYVQSDVFLDLYTPMGNTVYANHQGSLWKWTGSKFEPTTSEEQRRLGGTGRLSAQAFDDVEGWFSRPRVTSGPPKVRFTMNIGGQPLTLVVERSPRGDISIDLLRPGQASDRIWHVDEQPRRVGSAEYDRYFENLRTPR